MSLPLSAEDHNNRIRNVPAVAEATATDEGGQTDRNSKAGILETSTERGTTAKKENSQTLHPNAWSYHVALGRVPSPTLSEISVGENGLLRPGRGAIALRPLRRIASHSPGAQQNPRFRTWLDEFWIKNKGLAYVLFAQVFGVLMNVTTRYGRLLNAMNN